MKYTNKNLGISSSSCIFTVFNLAFNVTENKRFYSTSGRQGVLINNKACLPLNRSLFYVISIRYFSYTSTKLANCGGKHILSSADKRDLKIFAEEFAKDNRVPVLSQSDVENIESEKAVDLAAAFKDNLEVLEARRQEESKKMIIMQQENLMS